MEEAALAEKPLLAPDTPVQVRRHWDDWSIGTVPFGKLSGFRWDRVSGGYGKVSPRAMVYAYMLCTDLSSGTIGHSGVHGPCPHRIKVVLVKKDNDSRVVFAVRALADKARLQVGSFLPTARASLS